MVGDTLRPRQLPHHGEHIGLDPRAEGLRCRFVQRPAVFAVASTVSMDIAGRGLSRQHHRIRPIENAFATSKTSPVSASNSKSSTPSSEWPGSPDDPGTGARNNFLRTPISVVTDFHTQITPSDHHSVTCGNKIIQSYIDATASARSILATKSRRSPALLERP